MINASDNKASPVGLERKRLVCLAREARGNWGQACNSAILSPGMSLTQFTAHDRITVIARKARVEVEGGLYHVITRGNNRQTIFNSDDDYLKFLSLLKIQKLRLPFFLYAYCLMSNHVHLLLERQADAIGGRRVPLSAGDRGKLFHVVPLRVRPARVFPTAIIRTGRSSPMARRVL